MTGAAAADRRRRSFLTPVIGSHFDLVAVAMAATFTTIMLVSIEGAIGRRGR